MRVALYQPDIAGNLGTILRTCACMNVPVDIIEPCGFPFSDRSLKRAGMDYFEQADFTRHPDWDAFCATADSQFARIVLLSSKADQPYHEFSFKNDDILLFGSESAGVPLDVHQRADERITIKMQQRPAQLEPRGIGWHGIGRSFETDRTVSKMTSKLDDQQLTAQTWFAELRDKICAEFEAIERENDSDATFDYIKWDRKNPDGSSRRRWYTRINERHNFREGWRQYLDC